MFFNRYKISCNERLRSYMKNGVLTIIINQLYPMKQNFIELYKVKKNLIVRYC